MSSSAMLDGETESQKKSSRPMPLRKKKSQPHPQMDVYIGVERI